MLASTAEHARRCGGETVIVTSDRDAFALIDDSTRVLRIINGGVEASPLMTADRLVMLLGVRPEQYRDYAALRGDPSDNLPGVRGVGPRTAARLLAEFGSAAAAFDAPEAVAGRFGPGLARKLAAAGARENWQRNCQVMTMRRDVAVAPGRSRSIRLRWRPHSARQQLTWTVNDAVRVLAGVDEAPKEPPAWVDASWQAHSAPPRLPKLPPRKPVMAQLTLFDY